MIKAQDLRIGNLIALKGKIVKISAIDHTGGIDYKHIDDKQENEFIRNLYDPSALPIPLTEEWLERLGFVYKDKGFEGWYSPMVKGLSVRVYVSEKAFKYSHSVTPILFVHQVQNLYHTLTGEELTLKPTCNNCKTCNCKQE